MSNQYPRAYYTIARNIDAEKGQCVLILGPEIFISKSGLHYKDAFVSFIPPNSKSIYFPSENLFHFENDDEAMTDILEKVIKFFDEPGQNELLEKISNIKFPLIINVSPDKSLNKIYSSNKIDHTSGYLYIDTEPGDKAKIPFPTKEKPVIYNIFGSIDLDLSLILNHNKLFNTIEYIFSEDAIPKEIKSYLNSCNSFIFLGFKFDSWYYLLLCHKLGIKPNIGAVKKNKIYSPAFKENENVKIIIESSFEINAIDDTPMQCIQIINDICQTKFKASIRKNYFSVYVSYAHKDPDDENDRECFVKLTEKKIKEHPEEKYCLFYDKINIKPSDNIKNFMAEIGKGKIVIQLISDRYLTSYYCLLEALYINENPDSDKKVYYVLMEDEITKKEDNQINILHYRNVWAQLLKKYFDDPAIQKSDVFDEYIEIYKLLDTLITNVNGLSHLRIKNSDIKYDPYTKDIIINEAKRKEIDEFFENIMPKKKQNE